MDFKEYKTAVAVGVTLAIISGITWTINSWVNKVDSSLQENSQTIKEYGTTLAALKKEIDYIVRDPELINAKALLDQVTYK